MHIQKLENKGLHSWKQQVKIYVNEKMNFKKYKNSEKRITKNETDKHLTK